jgi:hypothetical protein
LDAASSEDRCYDRYESKFTPELSAMALQRFSSLLVVLMTIVVLVAELDQTSAKRK